jgi:DNA adenine methylase
VKPLLKWPGGKTRELRRILTLIPPHRLLVEPFVGGGALFFHLEPEAALLNDAEPELMGFYAAVRNGDAGFRDALLRLAGDRDEIAARARRRGAAFAEYVCAEREGRRGDASALARGAGDAALSVPAEDLLIATVADKARRLLRLEARHGKVFAPSELPVHFETALQGGLYTAVRDRFGPAGGVSGLARFHFLRELCYGSMFRYSSTGKFNIPYGGISYNRVSLRRKAERLLSGEVRALLARAELSCADFAGFLEAVRPRLGPDAFVFLDPPYDTEFSDYANRSFGRTDHERLAWIVAELPCPALLVIRETEFVRGLYEAVGRERARRGRPFTLGCYGKTYGYNVRGRNDRRARHLLVTNYEAARRAL